MEGGSGVLSRGMEDDSVVLSRGMEDDSDVARAADNRNFDQTGDPT